MQGTGIMYLGHSSTRGTGRFLCCGGSSRAGGNKRRIFFLCVIKF